MNSELHRTLLGTRLNPENSHDLIHDYLKDSFISFITSVTQATFFSNFDDIDYSFKNISPKLYLPSKCVNFTFITYFIFLEVYNSALV